MPYLIDGYNLLYAIGRLTPRSGAHALENARKELVQRLGAMAQRDGEDIAIVFDATRAPRHKAGAQQGRVEVVFAVGQTADDVIEERLASGPRTTVVSNDHRLKEAARRRGCACLNCLDFYEQLTQARPEAPAEKQGANEEKPIPKDAAHWLEVFGDIDEAPER